MRVTFFAGLVLMLPALVSAQTDKQKKADSARAARIAAIREEYAKKVFTHADTVRGSITPERAWWDVMRYDITTKPDFKTKTATGKNLITYKVVKAGAGVPPVMQIDLQEPLHIDSIFYNGKNKTTFVQNGNAWYVDVPKQKKGDINKVEVFYSGTPHESKQPPWSGGWTFAKDSLGRPWMTVTCQGIGASIWYPCKDHQSDEPDSGASVTIIAPDTLVAVSNGRLQFVKNNGDGTSTTKWMVVNPISNYCLIPYIGSYAHFNEVYKGEKGPLDVTYWVLDYNLAKAKAYFPTHVRNMLKSHEHWFGPYPFYEDGYQLIDAPHLGMEHQSAVAYGNHFGLGYLGRDLSGTGWGLKFDYIIVHESGHEWFGNNITTNDIADSYVHEGFTNYSETLYVESMFGAQAANEYTVGLRRGIRNDIPIISRYNVNEDGGGDMYPKGANMLHTIRHSMDDDEKFRQILRGLNKTFYHQTVNAIDVEKYISKHAGFDYQHVFDQYLRIVAIPKLEYYFNADRTKVYYRWTNCLKGFNLPLVLSHGKIKMRVLPSDEWKDSDLTAGQASLFDADAIKKLYYVDVAEVAKQGA